MTSPVDERLRWCGWCGVKPIKSHQRFCSKACRQAAFRLRQRGDGVELAATAVGGRFAYADPPYPGMSKRFYSREASYAGEVDHAELIAGLMRGGYLGWALSTSSKTLRQVLPLCPPHARVAAWVKPIGVSGETFGLHSTWEPLIVVGGRPRRGGIRDWIEAQPARGGGTLMGRKPAAFCAWLFDCLGMLPGDHLDDLFPGTGIVTRAWQERSVWASLSAGTERRRNP